MALRGGQRRSSYLLELVAGPCGPRREGYDDRARGFGRTAVPRRPRGRARPRGRNRRRRRRLRVARGARRPRRRPNRRRRPRRCSPGCSRRRTKTRRRTWARDRRHRRHRGRGRGDRVGGGGRVRLRQPRLAAGPPRRSDHRRRPWRAALLSTCRGRLAPPGEHAEQAPGLARPGRATHGPRAGDREAARGRALQQGDRPAALDRAPHRQEPRPQHPREARGAPADRGGCARAARRRPRPALMETHTAPALDSLLGALARLDALLAWAALGATGASGQDAAADSFRGLHISEGDVERLLGRPPAEPPLQRWAGDAPALDAGEAWPSLRGLGDRYGLEPLDLDATLIALAPELDLRYERLYAYLQDNVTSRRPTVELVLNLLCATAEERLVARRRFEPDAPLVSCGLVALLDDPPDAPLLARPLKVDGQIVRTLLGGGALDERLTGFCELTSPDTRLDEVPLSAETRESLRAVVPDLDALRVYLRGRPGSGRRRVAQALAAETGTRLLVVELARIPADEFARLVRLALREGELHEAPVYLEGADEVRDEDLGPLARALAKHRGAAILAGSRPWAPLPLPAGWRPLGVLEVVVDGVDAALRRE